MRVSGPPDDNYVAYLNAIRQADDIVQADDIA